MFVNLISFLLCCWDCVFMKILTLKKFHTNPVATANLSATHFKQSGLHLKWTNNCDSVTQWSNEDCKLRKQKALFSSECIALLFWFCFSYFSILKIMSSLAVSPMKTTVRTTIKLHFIWIIFYNYKKVFWTAVELWQQTVCRNTNSHN